ncbi:MAG: hypothetical protein UX59_C0024G0006 [Microgenomates group bacterium GW2011_GWA1_46_7]|nr:MAG: hypothetical protein UX59_C0024G0006 [Microgenomates group bacterium GW2011_GWA1_46_7]
MVAPTSDKVVVAGLVRKSNRILASISTHKFPIDLFPDTSAASPKKNVPSRQEIAEAASYRSEGRRKPKGRRVEATVSRSPMKVVSLGKINSGKSRQLRSDG